MSILSSFKELMSKLSMQAIVNRLEKRKPQHQFDTHRLFLYTSYWERASKGSVIQDGIVEELTAEAETLKYEGQKKDVARVLSSQVQNISATLHGILRECGESPVPITSEGVPPPPPLIDFDSIKYETGVKGKGLAMDTNSSSNTREQVDAKIGTPKLDMQELSTLLKDKLGYSLRCSTSSIQHDAAGDGLWLDGTAKLGSVVAIYPGVIYHPIHYRQMENYPKIDKNNSYLLSRFDGCIIDAKVWGKGQQDAHGTTVEHAANLAEQWINTLEGRHPLALAHYANHPPKDSKANVMLASIDIDFNNDMANLRRYTPNVIFDTDKTIISNKETIPGILFVALRDLADEEVFINYRMSPRVKRPDWYHPVDEEEDKRRWA